ncbi:MAG: DNA polymerase III subunit delta, partial [Oscillospiraceae bacterium]|nr:DNA polymerase III subunit delta [Oscillospiraceae bacterium]
MYGFDNVFHRDIMKNLIDNINNSDINHAYIFEGSIGLGKKSAARLFACSAVCNTATAPCGICPNCIQAKAGSSPDIKIINSGDKKSIGTDKIREEIIADVSIKP